MQGFRHGWIQPIMSVLIVPRGNRRLRGLPRICIAPVRPSNLTDYFRTVARRNVNKDRTIVLKGKLFEAPVALIGKRVGAIYHDSDPDRVEVIWNNHYGDPGEGIASCELPGKAK